MPLVVLFGLQVGIFAYMISRKALRSKAVTASGGISAGSMIMCCLHHLFEALPMLGLAGISLALAGFQETFLLIGNISALIGTFWMLKTMQKEKLYSEDSFWSQMMFLDWKTFTYTFTFFGVTGIVFLLTRIVGGLI